MTFWAWSLIALLSLAGLVALLLSLAHVRYEAAWFGMWPGGVDLPHETSVRLEFGFPGFMRDWSPLREDEPEDQPDEPPENLPEASPTSLVPPEAPGDQAPAPFSVAVGSANPPSGIAVTADGNKLAGQEASGGEDVVGVAAEGTRPAETTAAKAGPRARPRKDPHRKRRALFRIATDGPLWLALLRYGNRLARRAGSTLGLRLELSVGHPDPALLGRAAGKWYAVSALLPRDLAVMNFRFQDRHPSFGARVFGAFSLLALLRFGAALLLDFPAFRLVRRAWNGWRRHELTGWRAWTYRRIQSL